MQPARRPIGAVAQNNLPWLQGVARKFLASFGASELYGSDRAGHGADQYMRPPLDGHWSWSIDHRRVHYANRQTAGLGWNLRGQSLPEHTLQPRLRFAQAVEQTSCGDLGQLQTTCPPSHNLPRQVRERVSQSSAAQRGRTSHSATAT